MNVAEIMTRTVETISAQENALEAAKRMAGIDSGVLPVTSQDGSIVGVLTDRDIIVRGVAQEADLSQMRVEQIMSRDPVTCRPDCPIDAAANTMRDKQIRRVIVSNEHDRDVVGIVSLGDMAVRSSENELVGTATEGVCQPCD